MSRRSRIWLAIGSGLAIIIAVLVIAVLVLVQTSWFQNFVRERIIATTEDATGGRVEIGSFSFSLWHLHATVRDFVLHGTEPSGNPALLKVARLDLELKLFQPSGETIDLEQLRIAQPIANVTVFPNGKTNIPTPKKVSKPSSKSGLQQIVDLAVEHFEMTDGEAHFLDHSTPLNVSGQNLRVVLTYNRTPRSYRGSLKLNPIVALYGKGAPLTAHLDLPVELSGDRVTINNARLYTSASSLALSAEVHNMASPVITANTKAHLSLNELEEFVGQRIPKGPSVPTSADLEAAATISDTDIDIRNARLTLGETYLQASGKLKGPELRKPLSFEGRLSLPELAAVAGAPMQPDGAIMFGGNAQVNSSGYMVRGNLTGNKITALSGGERVGPVSLASDFEADLHNVRLADVRVRAFGGELTGNATLKDLQLLDAKAWLANFDLQKAMHDLGVKPIGYSGHVSGDLAAHGNLKMKGRSGYAVALVLNIVGGNTGVPVNGQLTASYEGKTQNVALDHSYITLPHSRLDLAGVLGKHLELTLVSQNLRDFSPIAVATSSDGKGEIPVSLQGGEARLQANVDGPLNVPTIDGALSLTNFLVEGRSFDQLSAKVHATKTGANVAEGVLRRKALDAQFSGNVGLQDWNTTPASPVSLNAQIQNAAVDDLLLLAGQEQLPLRGTLNASARIGGTLGNPLGDASVHVANGSAYGQPIDTANAAVELSDQLVSLKNVQITSGDAKLSAGGTYSHPADSMATGHLQLTIGTDTVSLANIKPLAQQHPGFKGAASLNAKVSADIMPAGSQEPVMIRDADATIFAHQLKDEASSFGDLDMRIETANKVASFRVDSTIADSKTLLQGTTQLVAGYPTTLDGAISDLDLKKTLLLAGRTDIPASGTLSAQVHVAGPVRSPEGALRFDLKKAELYGEPIDSSTGEIEYQATEAQLRNFQLNLPAGSLQFSATYKHDASNFNLGQLEMHASTSGIDMARIETIQNARSGLQGTVGLLADISSAVNLDDQRMPLVISQAKVNLSAAGIRYDDQSFGSARITATGSGNNIALKLDSNLAAASIIGSGTVTVAPDYPARGRIDFSNVHYKNMASLVAIAGGSVQEANWDALTAGSISFNGPLLDSTKLTSELNVSRLELSTNAHGGSSQNQADVLLQNQGPIDVRLEAQKVTIRSAHLTGPSTDIQATGGVDLTKAGALDITLTAKSDLGALQRFSKSIYSAGSIDANVKMGGTLSQPLANGHIDLKDASVNLTDSPNGISNANGSIILRGNTASIRRMTAESGGGKLTLTGYGSMTSTTIRYGLRASGTHIRTRYSGVSIISDAALNLNGTLQHSLLNGTITITRIALQPQSDAGSILSSTATPPETPTAPSGPLQGMRLDIHVITSSGLAVRTSLSQNLSANADLTVRGTLLQPGVIGQVVITQGNLVFFGNQYTVNRGVINFYDPTEVEPILDVSLQTSVQGVNVTLGVTGPIDNMKLNYRSDPPLRFDEIVALLAAGKTPTSDPTIAAHQAASPDQSLTQRGESAIVSQAVAAPLASRLQRVFGVNQIKIDPTFTGGSSLPQARVTLQQQISPTIIFTYTTDVTDTTAQIIRIEWAFTPRFSAVATRNEFGIVSLDFHWKKQVR